MLTLETPKTKYLLVLCIAQRALLELSLVSKPNCDLSKSIRSNTTL